MKTKDQGILIHKIPYSETSLIVKLFCRNSGLKTFLFQGAKKKRGNLLFPLAIIELEYYVRPDSSLAKISQIESEFVFNNTLSHPIKSCLMFFFSEILQATIRQEEEKDEAFFLFLVAEIHEFDLAPFQANYPIWFLIELAKWLGIEPHASSENASHLDGTNGKILDIPENSEQLTASGIHVEIISKMLHLNKDQSLQLPLNGKMRNQIIRTLLLYYGQHVDGFKQPKSLEVIETVLAD